MKEGFQELFSLQEHTVGRVISLSENWDAIRIGVDIESAIII
jgi:hypothetical protein